MEERNMIPTSTWHFVGVTIAFVFLAAIVIGAI